MNPALNGRSPHSPVPEAAAAVFCESPELGVLAFSGPDAESFLQGQLSNDIKELPAGAVQLSSYNSAKGRMLATLMIWRDGTESFRALVAADLAFALRKRLSMYVLRSKVSVVDSSPVHALFGVGGTRAGDAVRAAIGMAPDAAHVLIAETATIVALPDGRMVIVTPAAFAESLRNKLATAAAQAPPEIWRWLGIRAGVPMIGAATQDLFVPQTTNWDLLGGVNFHKGCYPGQEIIARTQYLGRLKERMHPFHVDGPSPPPGTRIYGSEFGDQACGTVVNAAPAPETGSDLLAVLQLSALDGQLHLGSPDGPTLVPLPLPYLIPAPVAPDRPKL
jgi:tRNA-modifying protein YgfZ